MSTIQENELVDPADSAEEAATNESQPSSRRQLFSKVGAALAAATAVTLAPSGRASAQRIVRPPTTRPPAPPASGDALLRLVRRVTNGVTQEELTLAKKLGFNGYLNYHLKPSSINDSAVDQFVTTNYPTISQTGLELYQQDQNMLLRQLQESSLYRAAFSKRQLYERMVEFWSDHFNIYYPKVNYLKVIDEREVVRKHALGKFPDMLRASAHSPAMLEYLDNTRSRVRSVNQNYARELMELHTLGVDGGYTQTDVEEVTRAFTGWTIQGRGDFRFDPNGHDFTAKVVLGQTIPAMATSAGAAGVQDGETVLNILIAHPSTARFIATKMARWLLDYQPREDIIAKAAATFTRTGGDIPSMIRDILTPANLLAAPLKYKQPYQLLLSSLRATQPTVRNVVQLAGTQSRVLGQALFMWEEPDGYPDEVDWWAGNIIPRWNFATYLSNLATGDVIVDVAPLMTTPTPDGVVAAINQRVFVGDMPANLSTQLRDYLAAGTITTARVREALALTLSSTEFQWY